MATITHVKKSQQRYTMVNTGVRTPVLDGKTGQQKVTKTGTPVFRNATVEDLDSPLPPPTCDFCDKPIDVGSAYKHITPKSGPYGGTKRSRHEEHPDWQVWEYSNSLSARVAQIVASVETGAIETVDDAEAVAAEAVEQIQELAEEKRESASSIEEGFGHETSQSEELAGQADELDSWASEGESLSFEDEPELADHEEDASPEAAFAAFEQAHEDWVTSLQDVVQEWIDGSPF